VIEVDAEELRLLCRTAIVTAGGDERTAGALADAVVAAERRGNSAVGVAHLFDYLDAFRTGRINGTANPVLRNDAPAVVTVSADDGVAQLAYAVARPLLISAVSHCGVAALSASNAFTVGELGYYTADLANEGLVALAVANSPALMSLYDAPAALTGTNPFSFAIPGDPPRLIDQASSAAAWVRIRDAAAAGDAIPAGWALDADGKPTTDPVAALFGPVLPFGGVKGSNLALTFELLSVLSGASFSMDAPDFASGDRPPRVGLFVVALDPAVFSADYAERIEGHLERLRTGYGTAHGCLKPSTPDSSR
jgi:(2R)-3-sulfolactate dehydrogenase (NADP+)